MIRRVSRVLLCRHQLVFFAIFVIAFCQSAEAKPIKIFVAGDGRADYPDPSDPNHQLSPRPEDKNGINECTMKDIAAAAEKEQPDVFLWTGDIANVNYLVGPDPSDKSKFFKSGLNAWFEAMKPVYDANIKVLATRGNHEVIWYDDRKHPQPISDAEKIWKQAFSGQHAPPPETRFDEKGLSFYYLQGSVLLIGLDDYENDYDDHRVNQKWLDTVLQQNKAPFVFAFGHEAMFATSTSHPVADTLAAHQDERDKLVKALTDAHAQVYLCGHDHFYDRMLATWSKESCMLRQIAAGTAGAPFYSKSDYPCENDWTLQREKHFDALYGYVLITVDGNTATVEFKGRNLCDYQTRDSFRYTVNPP